MLSPDYSMTPSNANPVLPTTALLASRFIPTSPPLLPSLPPTPPHGFDNFTLKGKKREKAILTNLSHYHT